MGRQARARARAAAVEARILARAAAEPTARATKTEMEHGRDVSVAMLAQIASGLVGVAETLGEDDYRRQGLLAIKDVLVTFGKAQEQMWAAAIAASPDEPEMPQDATDGTR